ncbi:hypothetical protein [Flavihumibacter sp. ZG627]|uniref:hypothetical protein n=1 Tax=Flavihumibacter sp. ZG627 TaxID=1463156 RepID=UPI00057E13AF|nr:hypothetical protein [Flavihumibacter sp. ZG627]KIC89538.1 hypothetical protein HY58_15570 [Flavihumibacter sp. ZG627]
MKNSNWKYIFASTALALISSGLFAQEVEIDAVEVESFFERNWMWITAGVVALLLIIWAASSGKKPTKKTTTTTTVEKDDLGNVTRVEKTTEVR